MRSGPLYAHEQPRTTAAFCSGGGRASAVHRPFSSGWRRERRPPLPARRLPYRRAEGQLGTTGDVFNRGGRLPEDGMRAEGAIRAPR